MQGREILDKAKAKYFFSPEEIYYLFTGVPLSVLIFIADNIRQMWHPTGIVTWIIDRNVNITNICVSFCRFCNFCRTPHDAEAYVTSMDEYRKKIDELYSRGGRQLLLQGGLHPTLGLDFYVQLFAALKREYPDLRLHALGPPEIVFLAKKENISYRDVLETLLQAGLDSLPGAGAEILVDRVRNIISPAKCSTSEWLDVMRVAHRMNIVTSATMMFGHVETLEDRIEHIVKIRDLQQEKPADSPGFLSFIPWPFQDENTRLKTKDGIHSTVTASDYLKMIAVSRIVLCNIPNIQASWLTVGPGLAQMCLHAGANDMGSVMMEENVVSSAGSSHRMDEFQMQETIRKAGFIPQQRNQKFDYIHHH